MTWRVAKSLLTLRGQVNAKFPDRKKDWDGTIGDEAHASRSSDHNPWVQDASGGVVTAMDITHDPARGVDSYKMAEQFRVGRDPRIKYIISNRRIASSEVSPWEWRPYSGTNPHDHHVHISVKADAKHYDDEAPWEIPMLGKVPSATAADVNLEPVIHDGVWLQRKLNALGADPALKEDGEIGLTTIAAIERHLPAT